MKKKNVQRKLLLKDMLFGKNLLERVFILINKNIVIKIYKEGLQQGFNWSKKRY